MVEAVGRPLVKQPQKKKMAAVAGELAAMAASPERVQRLTGCSWIRDALAQWPQEFTALSQRIGIKLWRFSIT
jgi:hypothetical protein